MSSIDVLIDDQIFLMHARGGISRYFAELLREFDAHPQWGINALTTVRYSPNQHLREVDPAVRDIPFAELSFGWKVAKRLARYPSAVLRGRVFPDVVHTTYYDPRSLDLFGDVPMVVTVHDMAPEVLPDLTDDEGHMAKKAYVDRAAAIICVSEKTRADLFSVWGEITDRPVVVTPHATSARFSPSALPAEPGFRYVLHVGARDGYKNFANLLTAYAGSHARADGVRLLALGGGPITADELDLARTLGLDSDELVQVTAAEADLPGYYRGAEVFVFPSLFEGFGIPVLEALATGTPTLLADTEVFTEVAGRAARYYPREDPWALRRALDEIVADPAERARLAAAGPLRAAEFSWERTALATAAVYRDVLEANR